MMNDSNKTEKQTTLEKFIANFLSLIINSRVNIAPDKAQTSILSITSPFNKSQKQESTPFNVDNCLIDEYDVLTFSNANRKQYNIDFYIKEQNAELLVERWNWNYHENTNKLNPNFIKKKFMVLLRTVYSLTRVTPVYQLVLKGKKVDFKCYQSSKQEQFLTKAKKISFSYSEINHIRLSVEYLGSDVINEALTSVSTATSMKCSKNTSNHRVRFLSESNINPIQNYQNNFNFEIINIEGNEHLPIQPRKYSTYSKTLKLPQPIEIKEIKPLDEDDDFNDEEITLDLNDYASNNKQSYEGKSSFSSRTNRIHTMDTTSWGSFPSSHESSFELEIESEDEETRGCSIINLNEIIAKYHSLKGNSLVSSKKMNINKLAEIVGNMKIKHSI